MATMGSPAVAAFNEPKNLASPKLKTPPVLQAIQYPCPSVVATSEMTCPEAGHVIDPWFLASPKAITPPEEVTSQYPPPSGVVAAATTGFRRTLPPAPPSYSASPKA